MIGTVWSQTAWADAWAPGVWADSVIELLPGGGNAPKTRGRRGGLLHEDRYFAANETAAAAQVADAINQSHPSIVLPHANYHEDEEIILLYMASLYGI